MVEHSGRDKHGIMSECSSESYQVGAAEDVQDSNGEGEGSGGSGGYGRRRPWRLPTDHDGVEPDGPGQSAASVECI